MKVNITDKFIWDIYNFFEKDGVDVAYFILSNKRRTHNWLEGPNPVIAKYMKDKTRHKFSELINYCKRKGYIKVENLKGRKSVMLTKRGIGKALKSSFNSEVLQKRKDGKWIMIIFDIPKNYSKSRDLLRSILKNLGYRIFQQSVWISPYDVFEKTEKSLQFHSLDRYIRIFLIEELS